jgi:hypothetical protein
MVLVGQCDPIDKATPKNMEQEDKVEVRHSGYPGAEIRRIMAQSQPRQIVQ